jgi:F-type H+-transporting ATPase subunit b
LDGQTLVQIVAQIFNICLLAFLLSKFLYKPVREFLAKRAARIRDQLRHADEDMAQANALKEEYAHKVKEIGRERDDILEAARKQATERSKEIVAEARNEADAIKARATRDIELEQERAKEEMRQAILDISAAMAGKYVAKALDRDAHQRLFDETLSELKEAEFRIAELVEA